MPKKPSLPDFCGAFFNYRLVSTVKKFVADSDQIFQVRHNSGPRVETVVEVMVAPATSFAGELKRRDFARIVSYRLRPNYFKGIRVLHVSV